MATKTYYFSKKDCEVKKTLFRIIGIFVFILIIVVTLFALKILAIDIDGLGQIKLLYLIERDTQAYRYLIIKKHSLAKFSKLKFGMPMDEVFKQVGKPTFTSLSSTGPFWDQYKIDKGWYIELHYSPKGLLCYIGILDALNDRRIKLDIEESSCRWLLEYTDFGSSAAQNIPAIEMVFVKGGTFTMGCTAEQGSDCMPNEYPPHNVAVNDFYIGKYVVTQELWKAVMGSSPSTYRGDNLPVNSVSWNDVQKFISELISVTGLNYRLPTEAEWEYAARGGEESRGYKYSGSNNVDDVAWCMARRCKAKPVGTKQPNESGIYDMSGNIGEWVDGWFVPYTSEVQSNPCSHCSPNDSGLYRMFRGGSCSFSNKECRTSSRFIVSRGCGIDWLLSEAERQAATDALPNIRSSGIGFRLALTAEQK
jgi:formylglycine-generating enzyme required for sulfatase activity